jgi:tetratricopeptide (TPR) repeat protein
LHYYLGASLIVLGNRDEGIGHFHRATEFYERLAASEMLPTAETHNNLGILYGQLQQHEESIRCFQRAAEIDPSQPDANLNLGELYFRLERFAESAACFRQVLEIEPQSARAHYNLGTIALTVAQQEEAIKHLQEALRIEPDHVAARTLLQQILSNPDSQ